MLHLIEGQGGQAGIAGHQTSLRAATIRYQGMGVFSFGAFKGRMGFMKNRLHSLFNFRDLRSMDIRTINAVLKFCVVCLAAYFAITVVYSSLSLRKEISLKTKAEQGDHAESGSQIASLLKSGSYYLEKARARDIFAMGTKKSAAKPNRGPSQKLLEATQNLKLVGISWSYDPDVMIEDTKTQRTYFLKKGQVIDSGVKLEAVFKDKVILSLEGEEIELR